MSPKNYAERYLDNLPWRLKEGRVVTAMDVPVAFTNSEINRRTVAEHNALSGIPTADLEAVAQRPAHDYEKAQIIGGET